MADWLANMRGMVACGLVFLGVSTLGGTDLRAQSADLQAGTLVCNVAGGGSYIVGSTKSLDCSFTGTGGLIERYIGRIQKIGLDIGVTGGSVIVWTVLAGTTDISPGALAGSYSGVGVDAAVGVGGGAKLLVGGSNNTISLQPLSLKGQSGLNVSVAVETISLSVVQ
ncbi:MAG: DUF992 domain-containing protein [Pseudomonadota bacterium]